MPDLHVPADAGGARFDIWLRDAMPSLTRARGQALIKAGHITLDGENVRPSVILRGGEQVRVRIPEAAAVDLVAEDIPLDVIYEDADLIGINKPAGLVVHPAPGHSSGTLVNALLHHCGDLAGVGGELRPGIVHRLDKDTSGILVAAKNERAMNGLQHQFKQREVTKDYLALVRGCPAPATGTIDAPIGRSAGDRKKMSTRAPRSRNAVSHYEVEEAFSGAARLRIRIETGRTHQIRVHLASIGHPVLGDALYGGKASPDLPAAARQMLHAHRLCLRHPITEVPLDLVAPPPPDFVDLNDLLAG